jgi:hypothetical protein
MNCVKQELIEELPNNGVQPTALRALPTGRLFVLASSARRLSRDTRAAADAAPLKLSKKGANPT